MRNQVTDAEIHAAAGFGLKASIYKVQPGVVTAYHPGVAGKSQPSVDVQPGVHDMRTDTETGAQDPEPWPIISQVPLAMAKGGGASIAFRMAPGDGVLLLSFDQDPTAFRASGAPSNPLDLRRHGGGHWIALPFDITDPGALADPGGDLVVTPPAGGCVVVGPGATELVALASKCNAAIKAWGTWAASGTGTGYVVPTVGTKPLDPDVGATLLKTK